VTWAILSCPSGILFESILRANHPQNGFHTAKIGSGLLAIHLGFRLFPALPGVEPRAGSGGGTHLPE
jgi:hypothetical protein